MTMRRVMKIFLATLFLACLAVSVQAAQLWPLETGRWVEMEKHDNSGNHWTVRIMVFEEATLDGKQYFRAQELYYDPYDINGGQKFSEFYMRSTDTDLYLYNGPGLGETLAFRTGSVGDFWEHQEEDENGNPYTVRREIVATNDSITIPYGGPYSQGGTYTAYQYKQYNINDPLNIPVPTRYDLEWIVPGLGMAKEEDHWVDQSQTARIPLNSALARVGSNPLFIPLKTGMRLTYDASDQQNHTWKMTLHVLEQVTLNDGLTYFHMRQTAYDPIGGDVDSDFYARCDASQMYVRKIDENPAHLEFQAAGPDTAWNYPRTPYRIYKKITAIQSVNVLGGSYLAYVTNESPDPAFPSASLTSMLVAPGLGPIEMLDWWVADSNRAPLQFLLAGISQGSGNPAVNLLMLMN
jgi:hypothetical protein